MPAEYKLIEWFHDNRVAKIIVGDEVAYLTEPEVQRDRLTVTFKSGEIKTSKVKEIRYFPGTGFAFCGDHVDVVLEDGTVRRGDSENGGWGLLKLAVT